MKCWVKRCWNVRECIHNLSSVVTKPAIENTLTLKGFKPFMPGYFFRFYHKLLRLLSGGPFDFWILLTRTCTRKCFSQDVCMYDVFFFLCNKLVLSCTSQKSPKISKITRTNVLLNLTKFFCSRKRMLDVLEIIVFLETFANNAPNNLLSANSKPVTSSYPAASELLWANSRVELIC